MKHLLLLYFFVCSFVLSGQQVYGYELDTIASYINDDPGLYQQLATRYQEGDTTLNEIEYLVLYYGSAYLDDYSPYGESLSDKAMIALYNEEKYEDALEMGKNILKENPAYVEMYFNVAVTYDKIGDTTNLNKYLSLYYGLLSIPVYSGTGSTMDSAMVVRSVNDEYVILRELSYGRPHSQGLVWNDAETIPYDLMKVKDEEGNEKAFYFNIYQPYMLGLRKMLGGVEKASGKKKRKKKKERKRKKKEKRKDGN